MASKSEKQVWETFVRRPGDLKEGEDVPMVLCDLSSGRKKYQMRHVVAAVSRKPENMASMDILHIRTVVGVLLSETCSIKILKDLPTELPGRPYHDFYEALRQASSTGA
jgi:hypothetical protein